MSSITSLMIAVNSGSNWPSSGVDIARSTRGSAIDGPAREGSVDSDSAHRTASCRRPWRMSGDPVPSDVDAPADPDAVVSRDVIDDLDRALREDPHQPPESDAAAVFGHFGFGGVAA